MSIATLAYSPIVTNGAIATSSAAGYSPTNALLGKISKTWRSTSAALTEYLVVDFGSLISFANTKLTFISNLPNVNIYIGNTTNPTTFQVTGTCARDGNGHNKISLTMPSGAPSRYLKIIPASGAPIDSAGYWSIGPIDLFRSILQFPRDPIYGESQIETNTPQSSVQLENGVTVKDDTGPSYSVITLNFSGGSADDHEAIMRTARAGLCWLDLGITANRGLQWRVKHIEPKTVRKITAYNRETVQIVLTEQV